MQGSHLYSLRASSNAIWIALLCGIFCVCSTAVAQVPPPPAVSDTQQPASDGAGQPAENADLKPTKVTDIDVDIRKIPNFDGEPLELPESVPLPQQGSIAHSTGYSRGDSHQWGLIAYQWQPTGFAHSPLYFEEVNLERYGNEFPLSYFVQPALSGMHFYLHVPTLPYAAAAQKPWEEKYVLGQYRPGNWAPFQIDIAPLDLNAAAFAGAFYTGFAFIIP